nr:hypothetical protein Ccrd_010332 [Tanacetum cinerariifolium]
VGNAFSSCFLTICAANCLNFQNFSKLIIPLWKIFIKKILLVLSKIFLVFPPLLSSSSQSLSSSTSLKIVTFHEQADHPIGHQVARTTRRVFGRNNYNRTLKTAVDPERQLEISRERRANLIPAEVLYSNNRSTARHRVYEHYSEQRASRKRSNACPTSRSRPMVRCNTTPIEEVTATGWGEEFSDDEVTPGKTLLSSKSAETISQLSSRSSFWDYEIFILRLCFVGHLRLFQEQSMPLVIADCVICENVVDHLTTNGITAIPGEKRIIEELEGMSWNLKPPEQTTVRVPSRVAVNERLNRSVSLRFERYRQTPQPPRYSVDQHDREVIGNNNLDADEEHFVGICLQTPQIEHTPYDQADHPIVKDIHQENLAGFVQIFLV